MKATHYSLCKLLAALFALCVAGSLLAADARRADHVFIISYDQGNPDLIQRSPMPAFNGMAAEGAHTWSAYTIVPSLTLPAHTSMLTGVGPQAHQVLWNGYQTNNGLVKVPTIFSLAKQHGLVTAMFVGKEKFEHLILPGSLDAFVWPKPEDGAKSVAEIFAAQVGKLKPNLCFIHFRDPDTAGHKYGANSPEKMQALADCDAALKTIKDAIAAAGLTNSVIILTADHGSHDIKDKNGNTVGTHGSAESADVKIPWIAWGHGVKKDFTITAPVVQYDTAATALWLLDVPLPENFWGRPVTSAFE
ncbi:MAG: ectonucleotide pyrophosphatase/phosphodiesterase [Verrucomicrobiales bacterium]|nr:ectonucleotide pyrophosphatase/phosphodiesterase [Verrucomicrobiales bacterium]